MQARFLCDVISRSHNRLIVTMISHLAKGVEKNKEGKQRKGIAMAQWVNCLWNNSFVNPPSLPLLYETSGAVHLVLLGLMAGWQADEFR